MLIGKSAVMILVAAAMAAPCIANAGSTSGRCGALRADANKIRAEGKIVHEEGNRSGHPHWCESARNMIRADDDMIAIITHDPAKCGVPDDRLEAVEAARAKTVTLAEGCP
jgi:hypothetical protein